MPVEWDCRTAVCFQKSSDDDEDAQLYRPAGGLMVTTSMFVSYDVAWTHDWCKRWTEHPTYVS